MDKIAKPGNRWLVVAGAILIQLALGAIYAWSVFTSRLVDPAGIYAFTASETAWVFSIGLATFAIVMVLASEARARQLSDQPIWIGGMGWCNGSASLESREWGRAPYLQKAAQMAYRQAGIDNPFICAASHPLNESPRLQSIQNRGHGCLAQRYMLRDAAHRHVTKTIDSTQHHNLWQRQAALLDQSF